MTSDGTGAFAKTVLVNYLIDIPNPYNPYQCNWSDTEQCKLSAETNVGGIIEDAFFDITFAGHDTRTGPSATGSSASTNEDEALAFSPSDHSSDKDGLALTYGVATGPAYGTVTLSDDGSIFLYTPNLNFNGQDSFTWRATNSDGDVSSPAKVSITVVPVDDPPTCTDSFSFSTSEDTAQIISFPCSDVDGVVDVTAVVDRAYGIFSSGTSATRTFTPAANFNGSIPFTYSTSAGSFSGTATVAPVADVHTLEVLPSTSAGRKLQLTVVVRHPDAPPTSQFGSR